MRIGHFVRVGFLATAIAWLIGTGGIARAEVAGFGPLPVRNFQPLQLLVLGMPGDRAAVLRKGMLDVRVDMAVTNAIFNEATNPPAFALVRAMVKFETLRTGVFLRYGLTDRLEVGLEVPALYRYPGILNGLITATERAAAQITSTRESLRGTEFAFAVSKDGRTLFAGGDHQLGQGDTTLISKYQMLLQTERIPAVSLRVAVKVPTGDAARFFGSGHTDFGVGLAIEKTVSRSVVLYGNVNGVFPTGHISGLALHPVVSGIAAAEYLWSPALSFIGQFDYYSSTYSNTGIKLLDRGVTEVALGFNYRLRNNLLWQVYGIENVDFITGGAADFTLSTVLTYRFAQ
ncbi:MAG TPA: DUF3187 family protein [Nitrospiraceae bacterium]|nr:DUF3187 family protein [Nitrospiraceae bacterium]